MFKTKFKKTIGIGLVAAACLISASTASAASQNESDVKVKLDDQQRNQYTVKSFHYLTVDGKMWIRRLKPTPNPSEMSK